MSFFFFFYICLCFYLTLSYFKWQKLKLYLRFIFVLEQNQKLRRVLDLISLDSVVSIWIIGELRTVPYLLSPGLMRKHAEMGDSWLKCYKMLCILYYSNNKMKKYWSLCSRSCTLEKERDKDNHLHSLFFSFGSFHSIKCDILWISFMILLLISSTAPPLISLWWASE